MKALPWKRLHFVGAGGVGVAGLAHIVADFGVTVTGSDARDSEMAESLRARGIDVTVGHDPAAAAQADAVVYSNAVPAGDPDRCAAREGGIPEILRGDFLALLAGSFDRVVSVGGSHGKTTTTAMIVHLLRGCGGNPGYLVGGHCPDLPRSAAAGDGTVLVTEVDESDGTQAGMRSFCAVVTNVEDDHCWSLGGMEALEACFAEFVRRADRVVSWDMPRTRRLFAGHPRCRFIGPDEVPPASVLPLKGEHNRMNAALAVCAAAELGVAPVTGVACLAGFAGVGRRLTVRLRTPDGRTTVVEDYAHHPTELRVTVHALREMEPGARLTVVFQPHRFERIKRYSREFAEELSAADEAIVYPPFAAWRDDADLADPGTIARGVRGIPSRYAEEGIPALAETLAASGGGDGASRVIAVVGAGDVRELLPALEEAVVRRVLDNLAERLRSDTGLCEVHRDIPWGRLTTVGIGAARLLTVIPCSRDELARVLAFGRAQRVPVSVIGAGSNTIGSDRAECRIVVRLGSGEFAAWRRDGDRIRAGAGLRLPRLGRLLADEGILPAGFEHVAWIPGTVGGCVRGNAGACGVSMADLVLCVSGLDAEGNATEIPGDRIAWGYRSAGLPDGFIVTEVVLRAGSRPPEAARAALAESLEERKKRLPRGRTAGSVFRNPPGDAAGRLLEAAGCKGLANGAVRVSREHANIFVAGTGATEGQFADLLCACHRRVFRAFGVCLEPEVVFAGGDAAGRVRSQIRITRLELERARGTRPGAGGGAPAG